MDNKQIFSLPFIILFALLWSCAPIDPYIKVKQQYPESTYYIGIGEAPLKQPMATNPRMEEVMARQAAQNLARAEIAKQIRISIREQSLDMIRQIQTKEKVEETSEITRLIESQTNEVLDQVRIIHEGKDEQLGVYRALAVMDKENARLNRGQLEKELAALSRAPLISKQSEQGIKAGEGRPVQQGVWVEGEGEAPLGLETTFGEAKARARDEARRSAVERAMGIYLKSSSVVYNFQLVEDLVATAARGIIEEEKILEEKTQEVKREGQLVGTILYVKIRAKVRLDRVEHKEFNVKASLNRTSFKEGDEAQIHVRPNQAAYVYIFSISQDEKIWQLLPNSIIQEHFVKAGEEFLFPDEALRNRGIKVRVNPPAGMKRASEKIKVIASKKKLQMETGKIHEAIFPLYDGREAGMIADLLKELALLDGSEWAEATLPYEVTK